MFTKIMYLNVTVSDQDKALEFYKKLGFATHVDHPGPDGRFLTIGLEGQNVELMLWKGTPAIADDNSVSSVNLNPGLIFIESDDLMADYNILASQGVRFIEDAPEKYPYGVRITALDPDGNRIAMRQRNK